MGQYHSVYNLDKKERIHAHDINNGLKLMEQVGWGRCTASAVWLLLANSNGRGGGDAPEHALIGHWAGDRLLVQGDYAQEGDPAYTSPEELEQFINISGVVQMMLLEVFPNDE